MLKKAVCFLMVLSYASFANEAWLHDIRIITFFGLSVNTDGDRPNNNSRDITGQSVKEPYSIQPYSGVNLDTPLLSGVFNFSDDPHWDLGNHRLTDAIRTQFALPFTVYPAELDIGIWGSFSYGFAYQFGQEMSDFTIGLGYGGEGRLRYLNDNYMGIRLDLAYQGVEIILFPGGNRAQVGYCFS